MAAPWIETEEYQDRDVPFGLSSSDYAWQALFACRVDVLPHLEWVKLKWGFNASALFDEALERQRLFLESRYEAPNEPGVELPDRRTLVFRFINRLEEGLSVVVIGKIQARTETDALERGQLYYSELKSTLPYDYRLTPAVSKKEFLQISGIDLLEEMRHPIDLAQIKRIEIPIAFERGSPFLQGLWQSGPHAHELVWRSLAASSTPALLNVSLRSTFLYDRERERLAKSKELYDDQNLGSALEVWNKNYLERRLIPWKKFFYLQIHLAAPRKSSDSLARIIGTSLSLSGDGQAHPGYRVICPGRSEGSLWRQKLRNLDFIFTTNPLPVPRLSEVADLDEVFAVMRLPYSPPESGFPDVNFQTARDQ